MKLAIFDIDGTVVNSINADDACFIQTYKDLYQIDLSGEDWNNYDHVTDSGLTNQIFEQSLGRTPEKTELERIQNHFYHLLDQRKTDFVEIPGISNFLEHLSGNHDISVAFATGGWRKTARLKLSCLKFNTDHLILRTADDHYKRTEIMKQAIQATGGTAESVTYFGDGLWDLTASNELQIHFVGVDFNQTGKLSTAGARQVIPDFINADQSLLR